MTKRLVELATVLLVLAALGCERFPHVVLTTPVHGSFTTAASVSVTGMVLSSAAEDIVDVTVNGVSVLPLAPDLSFSTSVTLDPGQEIQEITAELVHASGIVDRARVSVMLAESVADGALSLEGIALRINDSGLAKLDSLVSDIVEQGFDLNDLIGGQINVDTCVQEVFGGCVARVNWFRVDDATFSGVGLALDSMTNEVDAMFDVNDLAVDYTVNLTAVFNFNCTGRFTDTTTNIDGSYALQPDPGDPEVVDVNQNGTPSVAFTQFIHGFTGGACDFPVIGSLISLLAGDIQPLVSSSLETELGDPDGAGPLDAPIADGVEAALAGLEIAGPIGEAIGVSLEAPMFEVFEDVDGITIGSDARITASMPDPAAVDLSESFHVTEPFPSFSATAPSGAPYDLGMCISTSAFNQLLKAEIESGLLITTLSEIDATALGGNPGDPPVQFTGTLMAGLLGGAWVNAIPDALFAIDLYPTMAPVITGEPGPGSELATMVMPHLLVTIRPLESSVPLFVLAADVELGIDLAFVAGELVFALAPPQPGDVALTIVDNPLNGNELAIQLLAPELLGGAVTALASSLGSFPIPSFLDLDLSVVEIDRNGDFLSLFFDLAPAP